MKLQEQLDQRKAQFESSAPPEVLAVMHRATKELKDSGLMDKTLKKGEHIPDFALPDQAGEVVSSGTLLKKGSLVISVYRGVW